MTPKLKLTRFIASDDLLCGERVPVEAEEILRKNAAFADELNSHVAADRDVAAARVVHFLPVGIEVVFRAGRAVADDEDLAARELEVLLLAGQTVGQHALAHRAEGRLRDCGRFWRLGLVIGARARQGRPIVGRRD